jgi:uncharacterized protein (DUF362 family)
MKRRTFLAPALGAALSAEVWSSQTLKEYDISWEPDQKLNGAGLRIRDGLKILRKGEKGNIAPVLREEILDNPTAVFIIKAGITNERDENGTWKPCNDQMERFGRRVAELVFRKGEKKGGRTFINPNMVGHYDQKNPTYHNGWIVHPYLTAGFAEGLRDLGNTNSAMGVRGALWHDQMIEWGLTDIFNSHKLPVIEAHVQYFKEYDKSELEWHENPEGVVARRFPTYKPAYQEGTTFINMAHAHTHQLGHTTLTMKNLQGVMPRGYGHVCDSWTGLDLFRTPFMNDFNRDYRSKVEKSYFKHANMGFKHWDEGGFVKAYLANGGYDAFMNGLDSYRKSKGEERKRALERMSAVAETRVFWVEQWSQRMMDMIIGFPKPYVNMVEGVFGRGDDCGVIHTDFFTVSRSMTSIDAVTSWLMGHDPRELPYLRIAKERNIGENDIEKIPIYNLSEKGIERVRDYRTLTRAKMGVYQFSMKENGARFF